MDNRWRKWWRYGGDIENNNGHPWYLIHARTSLPGPASSIMKLVSPDSRSTDVRSLEIGLIGTFIFLDFCVRERESGLQACEGNPMESSLPLLGCDGQTSNEMTLPRLRSCVYLSA